METAVTDFEVDELLAVVGPFLTPHTALILLTAVVIGLVVGGLTFLNGGPAAGSALAGLLGAVLARETLGSYVASGV